jgi:hypothetical protein
VSDATAISVAILVPTVCFVVIGWFGWTAGAAMTIDADPGARAIGQASSRAS